MKSFFKDKVVAVTGACGTVGKELTRLLLAHYPIAEVIGLDTNESELFFMDQTYKSSGKAKFFLANVRDRDRLDHLFKGVDIVFHTAALKHVILCEHSPFEAVQSNIIGVRNVIDAANTCRVERVIFTSSDKAVNPTNVMGTSKLMGERLITAASSSLKEKGPVFASTRFGNVLGSRGSVIPIFREQIKQGGPVTVTDTDMSRFIMSIEQSTQLVIDSCEIAHGGEVFVTKMPVMRIMDLAEVMIDELAPLYDKAPEDIEIKVIGSKPGEKLYEELMNDEETRRTYELERYFAVLPAFRNLYMDINYEYEGTLSYEVFNPYNSSNEPALSKTELKAFLVDNQLIERRAVTA